MSTGIFAQGNFQISKDTENGSVVFKGPITFADLAAEPSFTWFQRNSAYEPGADAMEVLKNDLSGTRIIVVMGTWCEDSQNLVPRLHTVLSEANFHNVTVYGVDRTKDALAGEKATYGIERVPTIIVYKEDKEVGRIVEVVQKSIEEDLVSIVMK
ncbi:MAG: thioredoxin family protein [Flavipsychrobacter sp.]|nr:thioredoxin family protein [Flavipsychrobacter sp.]